MKSTKTKPPCASIFLLLLAFSLTILSGCAAISKPPIVVVDKPLPLPPELLKPADGHWQQRVQKFLIQGLKPAIEASQAVQQKMIERLSQPGPKPSENYSPSPLTPPEGPQEPRKPLRSALRD